MRGDVEHRDDSERGLPASELTELYRRYGYALHRRCRVLLRDDAAADDVLQEVFVKLMRAGAGVRDAEAPLRFLQKVADNACFDWMRKRRTARTEPMDDGPAEDVPAPPGVDHEARSLALRVLARLDDAEQSLAVMAYVDGLTQSEIARELGVTQPAVNKKLQKIREHAERALRTESAS